MMIKHILAATAAILLSCATAGAATFDFTSGSRSQTSGTLNYSEGGIDLKVSSARNYNPSGPSPYGVYDYGDIGQSNGNGLYIEWGSSDNTHEIDGKGKNEVAIFEFSEDVVLHSISFNYYDSNDTFSFHHDAVGNNLLSDLVRLADNEVASRSGNTGTYNFLGALLKEGSLFGIGALDDYDNFKIASITVYPVSVVPLPTSLPLYAAGIAVLGFVGYRRKKKLAASA